MFIWIKDTFVPSRLHFKINFMKRYCQTLDLKEDEQLIKEYCYWHSPEHIWPEIPEGIRAVGILNMSACHQRGDQRFTQVVLSN